VRGAREATFSCTVTTRCPFRSCFGEPLGLDSSLNLLGDVSGEDNSRNSSHVEHGDAMAETGNQASGMAINGTAPCPPPIELPSMTRSNTVLEGLVEQEISPEVGPGTSLSPATEVAHNSLAGTMETPAESHFRCEECTIARSHTVSFASKRSLERHKKTTKAHDAPPVAICGCGSTLLRKDSCGHHRKRCNETWLWTKEGIDGN
jgi:hypothetical protein